MDTRYLTVLRHAKAKQSSASGGDIDRPLAKSGFRQLQRVCRILETVKEKPDWIVSSPALRTTPDGRKGRRTDRLFPQFRLERPHLRRRALHPSEHPAGDARQRLPYPPDRPQPRRCPSGLRPVRRHRRPYESPLPDGGSRPFRSGHRPLAAASLGQLRTALPRRAPLPQGAEERLTCQPPPTFCRFTPTQRHIGPDSHSETCLRDQSTLAAL